MSRLLGAVEAGGTKFRCAVVSTDMTVVESVRVPTTDPDATLAAVAAFFQLAQPVAALGIASFGPV
ncbi:MAG: ROK family protein, partial [Acidimicrobiaceae bacterium]|nr:ROK family protein [Acidimicrobiaceae bacterium]